MKKYVGYICGTDPLEISFGARDRLIYPTVKSLKTDRSCWTECGILEIDFTKVRMIKRPKRNKK